MKRHLSDWKRGGCIWQEFLLNIWKQDSEQHSISKHFGLDLLTRKDIYNFDKYIEIIDYVQCFSSFLLHKTEHMTAHVVM